MKQLLSTLLLTALLMSACGSDNNTKTTTTTDTNPVVAVAVTPSLDCLPLYVAQEIGIADSMHIRLVLQAHPAKSDCDSALIHGSVVAALTDCVHADFISQQLKALQAKKSAKGKKNNTPADTLTIIPHDNLHLYLYANSRSRIREAKQLTDKMVAVDRKGATALVARHVLDSVQLVEGKAFLVEMHNMHLRQKMILANIMDAVVVPEPYSTVIRMAGNKSLYSTGHVAGKSIGCVAARKDITTIRNLYNRACDSINKNGIHRYDSILVKRMNITTTQAAAIPNHKYKKL